MTKSVLCISMLCIVNAASAAPAAPEFAPAVLAPELRFASAMPESLLLASSVLDGRPGSSVDSPAVLGSDVAAKQVSGQRRHVTPGLAMMVAGADHRAELPRGPLSSQQNWVVADAGQVSLELSHLPDATGKAVAAVRHSGAWGDGAAGARSVSVHGAGVVLPLSEAGAQAVSVDALAGVSVPAGKLNGWALLLGALGMLALMFQRRRWRG